MKDIFYNYILPKHVTREKEEEPRLILREVQDTVGWFHCKNRKTLLHSDGKH